MVDDFRLFEILDPYRDVVIKTLDQGAVCLNIDASQAGKTLSAEELAAMDKNDTFGDIAGVGPGRNWAHVNSVDYDPTDDSIIISLAPSVRRRQDRPRQEGQVDSSLPRRAGSPKISPTRCSRLLIRTASLMKCENSNRCEGGFDWTWTQHTGWRIDSKSDEHVIYLSVFDNGDGRAHRTAPAARHEVQPRAVDL